MRHSPTILILALILCTLSPRNAQPQSSYEGAMLQPMRLIDMHTAGILSRASFDFESRIYAAGDSSLNGAGFLVGINVGVTNRLTIGLSYGADGFIGRGKVEPYPFPGALIKYRIIEESFALPGFAIGYDHQGFGGLEYPENYEWQKGYIYKSPGFFLAASKNFIFLSKIQFGLHGGINFSLEEIRHVTWPNGYLGADLGINEELALAVEYDLALNQVDPSDTSSYINPLEGLLNAGVRWAFSPSFYIQFDFKDILSNKIYNTTGRVRGWGRELRLVYFSEF